MTQSGSGQTGPITKRTIIGPRRTSSVPAVLLTVLLVAGAEATPPAPQASPAGVSSTAEERLSRIERMSPEDGPAAYVELGRQVLSDLAGSGRSSVEAQLRLGVGRALRLQERFHEAVDELEAAAEIARQSGDIEVEASALAELARASFSIGDFDTCIAACETALALPVVTGDPDRSWVYENILAAVRLQQGDYRSAIEISSRALDGQLAIGNRHAEAILLNNIGVAHMYLGDYDAALEYFHRARVIKSELGETDGVADMLANIGDIKHLQGETGQAIELHSEALRMRETEGGEQRVALSLRSLAAALHAAGRDREALEHVSRALEIQRRLDLKPEIISCLATEASALASLGRGGEAVEKATEALDLARSLGMKSREVVALEALTEAHVADRNTELALAALQEARSIENDLLSSEVQSDFTEFRATFEARDRQRELELLRTDLQLKEAELHRQRRWRTGLIVAGLLLLGLGAAGWARLLTKQREMRARQLADGALVEALSRYRELVEHSPVGIFQVDPTSRVVLANRTFASMLGCVDPDELKGRSVVDLAAVPDEALRFFEELASHREARNRELALIRLDGEPASVLMNATAIEDPDSGDRLLECVAVDITDRTRAEDDRRRLELEIRQSQKLESLGVLAGGIAHDFNNMLMAILSNISLAKRSAATSDETLRRLSEAEDACLRATNLTQQLLTFSKGGRPIRRTRSVGSLVDEAAAFAARGSNCSLDCRQGRNVWPAEVDEGQLVQVIQNLVLNAIEAMPGGGTVTVTVDNAHLTDGDVPTLEAGRYVQIDVVDTGAGIPDALLDQIFDPFYTTKKGGSGLGLATAFSIVRSHGGAIVVRSHPERGSKFTVYLPASDKTPAATADRAEEPHRSYGRLLIMDDDEGVRSAAAELLSTVGYSVSTAVDGSQAIALYREAVAEGRPFDAVILDLTVPEGIGGRETMARLLEIDPAVTAIVSSGYSTDPVMANYREHGFSGVAVKPYRLAELARTLRTVLEARRTE